MNLEELLSNKEIKNKEKTETIANAIANKELAIKDLIAVGAKSKDTQKATCMEALEYATAKNPQLSDESVISFATENLSSKSSRLKWECARVIGNIAPISVSAYDFSEALEELKKNVNEGTVVRWSVARALCSIYTTPKYHNEDFSNMLKDLFEKEEKDSIKKIYKLALKQSK